MSLSSRADILEVLHRPTIDGTISSIVMNQPVFIGLSVPSSIHYNAILTHLIAVYLIGTLEIREWIFAN